MAKQNNSEINLFEKEILRLPKEFKDKLLKKEKVFKKLIDTINQKAKDKSMGFYITPKFNIQNNIPIPDFDKLTINFLYDDFERNIGEFSAEILLEKEFSELLEIKEVKDKDGDIQKEYILKEDKNIKFSGNSISNLRENCFDANYNDLKILGSSFIYQDNRGFISALKSIDIHRNMLLAKFEKYVVAYVGAGSWLRGEKSNDFDVFVVIDDTDVKRMPRMQVKDQLSKIIWQMSAEVAQITGVQIHIQVYLLTDFWDSLKDAHPVMFTFLRDGVPFYDRGIYSAWKELLKLGKIRPSSEAIDMHMNVGSQLLERAKKMFSEIVVNDIYNAVLSPSQAILMLKGYNPTTPKETIKMFKEVLLAKERSISAKDVETLENTIKLFKEIEHNKDTKISGKDVDKMIKDAEDFLKNIKKMFEEITEDKTKESILTSYNELLTQIRTLPGYFEQSEKDIFKTFEKDYISSGKLPAFVKKSLNSFIKAKTDYESGKITVTEVNKVLKEARNVMSEIKIYREKHILSQLNSRKITLSYDENKNAELINYDNKIYLLDLTNNKVFEYKKSIFEESKIDKNDLVDSSKIRTILINEDLIKNIKKTLNTKEIFI